MAGVLLTGADAQQPGSIDAFMKGLESLESGMNRLQAWSKDMVAKNLRACGFPKGKDVPLSEYLTAIARLPPNKTQTFERLCAYFQNARKGKRHKA